jgi:hypothetical protein
MAMKNLKTPKHWWKLGLGMFSVSIMCIADKLVYRFFKEEANIALTFDVSTYILLSLLFYAIVSGSWQKTIDNIKNQIMNFAKTMPTIGEVLHPMRYTLSSMDKSPDPFIISHILGKEETIKRLKNVL